MVTLTKIHLIFEARKMNNLNQILLNEIPTLEEAANGFLNGELTKLEFKKISGGFGVYAQRDGKSFIVRFRLPGGVLKLKDLKFIYDQAKANGLDYIHLTTRQCIQLHNLPIDSICTIMRQGLEQDLYTRGSGGNYPRNVAMSPLSGVSLDEPFDITPYAMASNLHLLQKVYTYKLPRKFKVAFSNTPEDTTHCTVQDMGFIATLENGRPLFKLYLGGGLGKDPKCGLLYPSLIEPSDVLYAIEALLALFVKEGDYENHHKARVRYMVDKLGEEGFITAFSELFALQKESKDLALSPCTPWETSTTWTPSITHPRLTQQRQEGYYSVYYQPIGGHLELSLLEKLINRLSSLPEAQLRLSMTEGMYITNLKEEEATDLLQLTEGTLPATRLNQSVSCIGVPTCQIGIQNSQDLLQSIVSYFHLQGCTEDILPSIYISGCPNSCGTHQIGGLGLMGKKKKVDGKPCDVFTLYVGGSFHEATTKLGVPVGDLLKEQVPMALYHLATKVKESDQDFSTWMSNNPSHIENILKEYLV